MQMAAAPAGALQSQSLGPIPACFTHLLGPDAAGRGHGRTALAGAGSARAGGEAVG